MALADQWTPTRALADDTVLTRAGGIPTGRGVKTPKAWLPPDFGVGADVFDSGAGDAADIPPAPPIPDQARDRWYQAALPNAAPPQAIPAPAPVAIPRDPVIPPPSRTPPPAAVPPPPIARRQATAPAGPPPPPAVTPGGGVTSSDFTPITPTPTPVGGWQGKIYNEAASIYDQTGVDPAIIATIGGTETGDLGKSAGHISLGIGTGAGEHGRGDSGMVWSNPNTEGGRQPPGFWAYQNGAEAAKAFKAYIARWQPELVPLLSDARKFFDPNGPIATSNYYVPTSQESARAGGAGTATYNYYSKWLNNARNLKGNAPTLSPVSQPTLASSDSAPVSAGTGVRSGGAAPAPAPAAVDVSAPPGVTFTRSTPPLQTSSTTMSAPNTRGDMGGPEQWQPITPTTWFSYADHGKEVLLIEDASGQTQYLEVGDTDQPDGTVIDTGTLDAQGQAGDQGGVGRGQSSPALPDETPPTTGWYDNLYKKEADEGIPASQVTDPANVNATLLQQGWGPGPAAWASTQVPSVHPINPQGDPFIGPDPSPMPQGNAAGYYAGPPGKVITDEMPDDPKDYDPDTVRDLEHEYMHAWESSGNPGGTMAEPEAVRAKDFHKVLQELGPPAPDPTWRGQGSGGSAPQNDAAHYNQTLFNMGYNPEDIPKWYRDKYLGEYVGGGQDGPPTRDDWATDPNLDPNVAQQNAQNLADIQDIKESQGIPVAGPPAPPPPTPVASDAYTPPVLTPTAVIGGYQKAGRAPPEQVTKAASQQFAEQQTPESAAATAPAAPDQQLTSGDVANLYVPPQGTPLSRAVQGQRLGGLEQIQAEQQLPSGLAETLVPQETPDRGEVVGQVSNVLDPTNLILGPVIEAGAGPVIKRVAQSALPGAEAVFRGAAQGAADIARYTAPEVARSIGGATAGVAGRLGEAALTGQEARSATKFATTLGGAAAGGVETAVQTPEDDPNRVAKIAAGTAIGGAGAFAATQWLPRAARAALAPAKNLPEPLQAAFEGLVNGENGANMSGELWRARIEDALGKPGKGLNTADAASVYEAGHPFATSAPHPQVQQLAKDMERFANDTGDAGRNLKYIGGDVRNQSFPGQRYFPHVYEEDWNKAASTARSKGLSPHNFYSNERTYPTLQDAVAAGKQPRNSVSEPFGHYAGAVLRSQARANFINDLKGMRRTYGIDVMRLAQSSRTRAALSAKGWRWGGDIIPNSPLFSQYMFEPQTAKVLENITQRATPGVARAALGVANEFKRSLLGLGTFHLVTEEGQALGAAGPLKAPKIMFKSLWNMWSPNFNKFRLDNIDLFQSAADAGVKLNFGGRAADVGAQATSPLARAATRAGVSGLVGGAYGYSQAKAQGASDPDAIRSALVWAAGTSIAAGTMGTALEQAVFERAIPTLKVMTYALYKDKFPETAVASFVNRTYGGNNLAAIGRSPQVQNVLRGTLLASDWWEGWVRQMGNAFLPGASGDLSRKYWAQMLGTAAFTLEGMNMVTGGHPTTDNEPGHQLELEVTNLYDKMGWSRRDPSSGGNMRVYWDVLGPLRPLATLAISAGKAVAGPAGQGALPGIGDQFGQTAGQFATSRLSPWLDVASQQATNKDYFGNPLVPPGMDPAHDLAMRVTRELGSFEPAPAQQYAQEQRRYGAGPAAAATLLGRRLSYSTPVSEEYRQRDDAITKAGGDLQRAQESVRQRGVEQDRVQGQIADMYRTPGPRTHAQIDQQEMDLRQKVQSVPDIYSDLSGAPIDPSLREALAAAVPGTSSSDALADLTPDMKQQIPTLADSYWRPLPSEQMATVDPNTQASIRRQKLQDLATQLGTDPATLLDAFKAQQRNMPMPALGDSVTSAEVESWVSDYVNAGKDATDPAERSAARGAIIDQIASDHPGVKPDDIQARINLRLTPSVADVPEPEQSHQKALDALMQGRTAPKYVDESGKPMGTPQQWQQYDDQIKQGTHKKGIINEYDPKVKPLVDARERAVAAKNQALLKSPAHTDYQRWFGEGRNMTEAQWQSYQSDPGQRWKDHPTGADAQARVQVMQGFDAYTPAQRRTLKVKTPILVNGRPQQVTIEAAYKHFKSLEVPDWQKHLR